MEKSGSFPGGVSFSEGEDVDARGQALRVLVPRRGPRAARVVLSWVAADDYVIATPGLDISIGKLESGSGAVHGLRLGSHKRELLFGLRGAQLYRFPELASLVTTGSRN